MYFLLVELHKIGLFYFPKSNQSDMVEILSFTHTFTHKKLWGGFDALLQMLRDIVAEMIDVLVLQDSCIRIKTTNIK